MAAIRLIQNNRRRHRRQNNNNFIHRNIKDRSTPLEDYEDHEIYDRYRFRPQKIYLLCQILEPTLKHATKRSKSLTVLQQVLIALNFLATGSFYVTLGDIAGVSKQTVMRAISDFCVGIIGSLSHTIRFPTDREILLSTMEKFGNIAGE